MEETWKAVVVNEHASTDYAKIIERVKTFALLN